MKHLVLLLMLVTFGMNAQDSKLVLGVEVGSHAVGDQSAVAEESFGSVGATIRYEINPVTSAGISAGWDNLSLLSIEGERVETNYGRIHAELFVDVFEILQLSNNAFTVLVHGGPGFSRISTSNSYQDNLFSATAGVIAITQITSKLGISLSYRNTANITQDKTLDGMYDISNTSVNSTVSNFSAGLVYKLGKRK